MCVCCVSHVLNEARLCSFFIHQRPTPRLFRRPQMFARSFFFFVVQTLLYRECLFWMLAGRPSRLHHVLKIWLNIFHSCFFFVVWHTHGLFCLLLGPGSSIEANLRPLRAKPVARARARVWVGLRCCVFGSRLA